MPRKRYQTFVSSTFKDLIDERQAVMQAILKLGHFPSGMELFPARDQSLIELIKSMVADADYYVLIVGGQYGSIYESEGISYTEFEYNYVMSLGTKPVLRFIHNDWTTLDVSKREVKPERIEKLNNFVQSLKRESWLPFHSIPQLQLEVNTSLHHAMNDKPGIGWMRSDELENVASEQLQLKMIGAESKYGVIEIENSKLKQKVQELQSLVSNRPGSFDPAIFDKPMLIQVNTMVDVAMTPTELSKTFETISVTWKELYLELLPIFLGKVSKKTIGQKVVQIANRQSTLKNVPGGVTYHSHKLQDDTFNVVMGLLTSHGVVEELPKDEPELLDTWTLTLEAKKQVLDRTITDNVKIVFDEKFTMDKQLYFRLKVWNEGQGKDEGMMTVQSVLDQDGKPVFDNLPSPVHWCNYDKTDYLPITRVPKLAGIFITPSVQRSEIDYPTLFQIPKTYNTNIDTYVNPNQNLTKLYFHVALEIKDSDVVYDEWYVMKKTMELPLFANEAEKLDKPTVAALLRQFNLA